MFNLHSELIAALSAHFMRHRVFLPYAPRVVNPFPLASSGGIAGDFPQPQAITILAFRASVHVATTNNGSNFWTVELVNTAASVLASFTTAAMSANTWTRAEDTSITQPSSSNVDLAIKLTATGSPGAIFVVPDVLAVPA
jgi:hypothetical protein